MWTEFYIDKNSQVFLFFVKKPRFGAANLPTEGSNVSSRLKASVEGEWGDGELTYMPEATVSKRQQRQICAGLVLETVLWKYVYLDEGCVLLFFFLFVF